MFLLSFALACFTASWSVKLSSVPESSSITTKSDWLLYQELTFKKSIFKKNSTFPEPGREDLPVGYSRQHILSTSLLSSCAQLCECKQN